MTDIPEDVMKAAEDAWIDLTHSSIGRVKETAVIARAIMAERERCAKVARAAPGLIWEGWQMHATGADVAAQIMEGGEPWPHPVKDRPIKRGEA